MVLLNSPQIGAPPIRSNPDASPEKLCTEVCAHAICRKFGGRTFLRQFFPMADVKKTRVNTGEKDGGPGRDRTDDLFHAMEARSQLRHRPTLRKELPLIFSLGQGGSVNDGQAWASKRFLDLEEEFKLRPNGCFVLQPRRANRAAAARAEHSKGTA